MAKYSPGHVTAALAEQLENGSNNPVNLKSVLKQLSLLKDEAPAAHQDHTSHDWSARGADR
jgi:hypothetical protein